MAPLVLLWAVWLGSFSQGPYLERQSWDSRLRASVRWLVQCAAEVAGSWLEQHGGEPLEQHWGHLWVQWPASIRERGPGREASTSSGGRSAPRGGGWRGRRGGATSREWIHWESTQSDVRPLGTEIRMDEWVKVVLPALIGLVGTLAVVLVGYRQWKRQHDKEHIQAFQTARRLAYEKLWGMLEKAHVEARTSPMSDRRFRELVQELNALILRSSLYVGEADASLSRQYLDAVFRVSRLMAQAKSRRAKREWIDTRPLSAETLEEYQELNTAWCAAETLRDQVISRFQGILLGRRT